MDSFTSAISEDAEKYFSRNGALPGKVRDPVLEAIRFIAKSFDLKNVLEVGCASGSRLNEIHKITGANCVGLDASKSAVAKGSSLYPDIQLFQGIAPRDLFESNNGFKANSFECIIIGFVSYLIPREEIFLLTAYIDRLLAADGHLVIFDFIHPRDNRRNYAHDQRLTTFKTDPSAAWTWSPTYFLANREIYLEPNDAGSFADPHNWMTVDTLRKFHPSYAFPNEHGS